MMSNHNQPAHDQKMLDQFINQYGMLGVSLLKQYHGNINKARKHLMTSHIATVDSPINFINEFMCKFLSLIGKQHSPDDISIMNTLDFMNRVFIKELAMVTNDSKTRIYINPYYKIPEEIKAILKDVYNNNINLHRTTT